MYEIEKGLPTSSFGHTLRCTILAHISATRCSFTLRLLRAQSALTPPDLLVTVLLLASRALGFGPPHTAYCVIVLLCAFCDTCFDRLAFKELGKSKEEIKTQAEETKWEGKRAWCSGLKTC